MNQEASLSFRQANLRASSLFLHQMAFWLDTSSSFLR
jgi:hypothetical protein